MLMKTVILLILHANNVLKLFTRGNLGVETFSAINGGEPCTLCTFLKARSHFCVAELSALLKGGLKNLIASLLCR